MLPSTMGFITQFFKNLKLKTQIFWRRIVSATFYNCNKYALKALQFDVQSLVLKVYSKFFAFAKRTAKLKEFYEFAQSIFRNVLTRWVSLLPALDSLELADFKKIFS